MSPYEGQPRLCVSAREVDRLGKTKDFDECACGSEGLAIAGQPVRSPWLQEFRPVLMPTVLKAAHTFWPGPVDCLTELNLAVLISVLADGRSQEALPLLRVPPCWSQWMPACTLWKAT